jgi:hypothetical protein
MRQRLCLAGAGACRNQQRRRHSLFRANPIACGTSLGRVQPFQDRVNGGYCASGVLFTFHQQNG